jgi:hypothetical protein
MEAAMRRPINWFVVVLSAVVLFAGLLLQGCGGSGSSDDPGDNPQVTGLLRPVHGADELESSLKQSLARVIAGGVPEGPINLPAASVADFSKTYTVETGVDELDFSRYDGRYLYVAPTLTGLTPPEAVIRILRTDPASATATQVGSIPIDASQAVVGMYVANDRLFLVSTEAYYGPFGGLWADIFFWAPTKFTVQVHDVRDPAQPRRLLAATIDGVFVESRRIEDRVVIVSRHTPEAVLDASQRMRLALMPLRELMPGITIDGRRDTLVDPRHCYVGNDGSSDGYPVITSISTFSLANPLDIDGICYDEQADGVYASTDALYVSEPRISTSISARTRIHKFTLHGARPDYSGSVELPGAIWSGGQRDFRMDESEGRLRVLTTEPTGDAADFFDHRLFVLRQKPGERALEILGQLPNDSRPEEIGKPNENLFGVRFLEDRVFAVTFERIDPLYVIDLSTPADPRIAGQLLLPGFMDFLHPVTDNLLLGLGRDGAHFKLELFDTSVLELPQSRGLITLGGVWSDSQAIHDRHAFAYLAGPQIDRFAVPADINTGQPGIGYGFVTSLHQFEVVGKQTASSAVLREAGVVSPPSPALPNSWQPNRSFISGDAVYYVRDGLVWGTFWSTPSQVNGPF